VFGGDGANETVEVLLESCHARLGCVDVLAKGCRNAGDGPLCVGLRLYESLGGSLCAKLRFREGLQGGGDGDKMLFLWS